MSDLVLIVDRLQKAYDYSSYTILRDIILIVVVYITYNYLPFDTFCSIWKVYFCILLLRFALSELTNVRKKDSDKKYFQTSGHMALFTLSVLFAAQHNLFNLQYVVFRNALLAAYGILNVIVHAHYTTDIINTTFLTFFIFSVLQ